jgi:hypothetical protein
VRRVCSAAQLSWRQRPVGENGEGSINFGRLGFCLLYVTLILGFPGSGMSRQAASL